MLIKGFFRRYIPVKRIVDAAQVVACVFFLRIDFTSAPEWLFGKRILLLRRITQSQQFLRHGAAGLLAYGLLQGQFSGWKFPPRKAAAPCSSAETPL